MTDTELIEWAEDDALKIEVRIHEIADTGDYDFTWVVTDCGKRESYGKTMREALEQAQMSEDDERRWDYIPPEFRS